MLTTLSARGAARLAAVLVGAFAASSCAGGSSLAGDRGAATGEGVIEQVAVADRKLVPAIEGHTLDGGTFDSRNYLGQVVVVNVWGSWCTPCRAEAPTLRRVWEQTRGQGVQFVGIDVRDNVAAAVAFERRFKITYPSITAADSGPAILAFGSTLPLDAVPSTLVVDRNGRVAARVVGPTTYVTLRDLVESVESEPAKAKSSEGPPQ